MNDIDILIDIAKGAGEIILKYYHNINQLDIITKKDGSPLTLADEASHCYITARLLESFQWPVLSEENPIDYEIRKNWNYYWLVDPLDGTKDFIAANDEFTVNIALIYNSIPVLGLIYAPALDELYFAKKNEGAFLLKGGQKLKLPVKKCDRKVVGRSRFHESDANIEFSKINSIEISHSYGSALKFGKLAMGEISIYPRFVGSSEWDIAAGHLILTESECEIVDLKTFKEPLYNKLSIRNNFFLAFSNNLKFSDFKLPKDI